MSVNWNTLYNGGRQWLSNQFSFGPNRYKQYGYRTPSSIWRDATYRNTRTTRPTRYTGASAFYGGPDSRHAKPGVAPSSISRAQPLGPQNPGPTGPGGAYPSGGAGVASAGGARPYPTYTPVTGAYTPGMNQYSQVNQELMNRLRAMENQYGKLNWGFTPQQFTYEDWAGRDPLVNDARARIQGEIDYAAPFWQQAAQQANRQYDLARERMIGDRTEDINAIGLQGQQDFGRLSNMAANMGLNVGQGALANQYGVMANTAAQQNNVQRDYAQMLAEAAAQRQGELGQIRAEEMGTRASAEGRAQALADELAMQDFERYMGLRSQAAGEHFNFQDLGMANERQRLDTRLAALQGREGLLGAQAGLNQDARNFAWNDWWRNKDFNYTEQWDIINNAYRNWADQMAMGTDNTRYADAQRLAEARLKLEQDMMRLQQQMYGG